MRLFTTRDLPLLPRPDQVECISPGRPFSALPILGPDQVLRRACEGSYRGSSGRDQLRLSSRFYIVLADFEGRRFVGPCVLSRKLRPSASEALMVELASGWPGWPACLRLRKAI